MDHDLEQVIHSIGLNISRGDIQRLNKKLSTHDHINYRNYTDKWVDKDLNVKYVPTPRQDAPSMAELISGHVDEKIEAQPKAFLGSTPDVTDTGIVSYRGSVLNISHIIEQQKKVESERETALTKIEELEAQLSKEFKI